MKNVIRKWIVRLTVTSLFITGLLLVIILNPVFTYANKTTKNNYTVFHNKPLDDSFEVRIFKARQLTAKSEYYNPKLKLDICLNDGSIYPSIIKVLRGNAFAWGFYDKVVLSGNANFKENYIELNGYKWNLTELIAHEMTHCFQFDKLGFWKSNPIAKIPDWKWEGYPEYVARNNADQKNLKLNIDRLIKTEKNNLDGWIQFSDSTGTVISYYKSWLLIQYCMDVKRMTYKQVINDTTEEKILNQQMMNWYNTQK